MLKHLKLLFPFKTPIRRYIASGLEYTFIFFNNTEKKGTDHMSVELSAFKYKKIYLRTLDK